MESEFTLEMLANDALEDRLTLLDNDALEDGLTLLDNDAFKDGLTLLDDDFDPSEKLESKLLDKESEVTEEFVLNALENLDELEELAVTD